MRVIGVLDLLAGRAVHARAGRRDRYEPVCWSGLLASTETQPPYQPGDAVDLARWYMRGVGLTELYVADLDAILGRPRQDTLVASVSALGAPIWLDAAAASVSDARHALELAAAVVVIGLETLPSYGALAEICAAVGGDRVAFSLDLRDGEPIATLGTVDEPAHVVAERAADAGAGAIIVIDLARVGTGAGLDLALIGRVRGAVAGLTLLAGGGVRGPEDLAQLADVGCDGALVATAVHQGRLGAGEVAVARQRHRNERR
jgi:phosphoribosylformimino-5-aminoimidazole carboxamide ribotide isomerase